MVVINVPFSGSLGADGATTPRGCHQCPELLDRESVLQLEVPGFLLATHRTESPIGVTTNQGVIDRAGVAIQFQSRILKPSRGACLAIHAVGKLAIHPSGIVRELRGWLDLLAFRAPDRPVGFLGRFTTLVVVLLSGLIRVSDGLMTEQALHALNFTVLRLQQEAE